MTLPASSNQDLEPPVRPVTGGLPGVEMRRRSLLRRIALLVVVLVAVTLSFFQLRDHSRRRSCRASLSHYATHLKSSPLDPLHLLPLETQWNELDQSGVFYNPNHYRFLPRNWQATSGGLDRPLAVCAQPHVSLFSRGRHVLIRGQSDYEIVWLEEDAVPAELKTD